MTTRVITISLGYTRAYLLRGDGNVLVDARRPGDGKRILCVIAAVNLSPDDINLVILTHCHFDHIGGAERLREETGAPIMIHRDDAAFVRLGSNPELRVVRPIGNVLIPLVAPGKASKAKPFDPDIVVDGGCSLDEYGISAELIHTPGHTPGSISVLTDGGEAIVGDHLMGKILRPSRPDLPFYVNHMEEWRRSTEILLGKNPLKYYVAHGGPFSGEDVLKRFGSESNG
ncbi:MAG: MBL fold metallo-hydrolase [bacterium]|nr:MBL fold metallo-hydrolase [bacterium]